MRHTLAILATSCIGSSIAFGQSALPVPDYAFKGNVGRTIRDSDPPEFPQPTQLAANAPNVVVIMLDDVGFGQFSAFGGEVPSPAMEKLASEGLRYSRFHTAGICSPTRAALLTGRNPHNSGFGLVGELATGYDGYVGSVPRSTATFVEVLRQHGYATAMFGKNHNTPNWEGGPAGPFNHWPTGMGFDYFYGFNGWGTSQWQPVLYENTRPVPPSGDPNYQLNTDLADRAIAWVRTIEATDSNKPFFLYIAPGATHAPHHAPPEWIAKFKGKFDSGWDEYRRRTFERQKASGVVPSNAKLTPRPGLVPAWSSLSAAEQKLIAYQMEIFAAFGAYTDYEMGRVLDAIRTLPDADNTLVIYVVGDNGASAEGGREGKLNEVGDTAGPSGAAQFTPEIIAKLGGPKYNNHFAMGWAWAMNTPFQYYKQVVSHLGAIRNPLIVAWPARIRERGGIRQQFLYATDIAPTILEAAHIEMPTIVNGIAQKPLDGASMLPTFADATAPESHSVQYFEVFSNRAIYDRGWFASAPIAPNPSELNRAVLDPDKVTWELYDLSSDFSQSNDLAASQPAKLKQMQDLWWAQAAINNVLPLDWRTWERLVGTSRPNAARGRNQFTFYPGMIGLPEAIAPATRNRSWRASARGKFDGQGMIITQGGMTGGWALYISDGRLAFDYNHNEQRYDHIVAGEPLPADTTQVEVRFTYDGVAGKDLGAGGVVTLWANDRKIGAGRLPKTVSRMFSVSDNLDVGADYGSPVSDQYPFPFPFTGELQHVTIQLE